MKGDVGTVSTMASYVATSGSIGLFIGSLMGLISFKTNLSRQKGTSKLRGDITSLKTDVDFLDAVLALHPYRGVDLPRSGTLFDTMLRLCNNIVKCHLQMHGTSGAPGVFQFSMNRYLVQLRDASKAMQRICERKVATNIECPESEDGGLFLAYEMSAEPLLECADVYIHNSIMHGA